MLSLPDFTYKQLIFYNSLTEKIKLRFQLENIVIEDENAKIMLQHSCHKTFALFIIGNLTVTNVVLQKAKEFGFPILLLSRNLRLYCYINNRAEGNFLLRKMQYNNGDKNIVIAKKLVENKINNQTALLEKLRYRGEIENKAIGKLKEINISLIETEDSLRGVEGIASKIFFSSYFHSLNWRRREPRTKVDINNLLLDIGYTYLFHFIEAVMAIYGFDVFCGVYHTFFYQRKSLICDLIEPFRCIIDQRLRKAHNLKQIDEADFFIKQNAFQLSYKSQGKYIKLFLKDILFYKEDIFLFIQSYYRWFVKGKKIEDFPQFSIISREV